MRVVPASLAAAALVGSLFTACSSSPPLRLGPAPTLEGMFRAYRFSQRMEDGAVLEGQFVLAEDTIMARTPTRQCDYEAAESNATQLGYDCGSFKLRFERRDPATLVYYETTVQVRRTPATCRPRPGGPRCEPET